MNYTLSRPSFNMFADVLGKDRAEAFVSEFEQTINEQRAALEQQLTHNQALVQAQLKAVVKEELRNELVTREVFEERFKVIDERFKSVDKRFEQIDKRFEQMDKRFEQMANRMDSLMIWGFATIATFSGLTVAAIKLLP